jgi:hypothetical protein
MSGMRDYGPGKVLKVLSAYKKSYNKLRDKDAIPWSGLSLITKQIESGSGRWMW